MSQLLNYPQNGNGKTPFPSIKLTKLTFIHLIINKEEIQINGEISLDLEAAAKETQIINAKSASIDHTYKIKQNESQLKQQQRYKRTKTAAADSPDSDDESKNNKKFKKTTSNEHLQKEQQNDEPTFTPGEFLIHRSTFQDYENYDIWCVRDDGYLQKYEPVYLSTGERCHQSADVLAQYTPDKSEFFLVKVEEKGKTEQNNVVVCVLVDYEPKNNPQLLTPISPQQQQQPESTNVEEGDEVAEAAAEDSKNKNCAAYDELKPTFDIFLQILLSQFINSEFLFKIKEIQDDYFKPALDLIDSIISQKYQIINQNLKFNENYKKILNEKPKIMIQTIEDGNKKCQVSPSPLL